MNPELTTDTRRKSEFNFQPSLKETDMNQAISHTESHRRWLGALAVLCMGAAMPSAFANVQTDPADSITVKYADLDLSKPAGAETLYLRIKRAARMVCSHNVESWDARRLTHERECVDDAIANAVKHVNKPTLTAMYREHSKNTSFG
jgi:UrcA family protein